VEQVATWHKVRHSSLPPAEMPEILLQPAPQSMEQRFSEEKDFLKCRLPPLMRAPLQILHLEAGVCQGGEGIPKTSPELCTCC